MDAVKHSDIRASNGAAVPKSEVKRPEVRPDVSFWDIEEVKKSKFAQTIRAIVRGFAIVPVLATLCFVIREVLRSEAMGETAKVSCVIAGISTLAILGLAALFLGAKNHAETSQEHPDKPFDSGDGGCGAQAT